MLASTIANETRLKTASEFGRRELSVALSSITSLPAFQELMYTIYDHPLLPFPTLLAGVPYPLASYFRESRSRNRPIEKAQLS